VAFAREFDPPKKIANRFEHSVLTIVNFVVEKHRTTTMNTKDFTKLTKKQVDKLFVKMLS